MPVISRFHGIVIKMFFIQAEHNPPHIHAPYKEQNLVKAFIVDNRTKLQHMWDTQEFELIPSEE